MHFVSFYSQFVGVETCTTVIIDWSPRMRKYKSAVSLGFCVICYLIGLAHVTQVIIHELSWLKLKRKQEIRNVLSVYF